MGLYAVLARVKGHHQHQQGSRPDGGPGHPSLHVAILTARDVSTRLCADCSCASSSSYLELTPKALIFGCLPGISCPPVPMFAL